MAEEQTNATQNHASNLERLEVTPAARLFDLLWPGANAREISDALGARVSPAHVRMWRTGARPLPSWIRDLARARMSAIDAAIKANPAGPGKQAGWRNVKGYQLNMRR